MIENKNGGMGFLGWVQLMFIGLKISNVIDWSWVRVFLPTIFVLAFYVVVAIGFFTYEFIQGRKNR